MGEFRIQFNDPHGTSRVCSFAWKSLLAATDAELETILANAWRVTGAAEGAVSVVWEAVPVDPQTFAGSYAQFPGAWLRIAPDAQAGGIIATADHMVLDGAFFQKIVGRLAMVPWPQGESDGPIATPATGHIRHIRTGETSSNTALLLSIVNALEEGGMSLLRGRETILLTTIPQGEGDASTCLPKHQCRILPLVIDLGALQGIADLRQRIHTLNTQGSQSIGYQVWSQIYRGDSPDWLVYYFERLAKYLPFQWTSRYMSGQALVSFLPVLDLPGYESCPSHVTMQTLGPTTSGPIVTVMQVRTAADSTSATHITLSGSYHWDHPARLEELKEAFCQALPVLPRQS